MSDIQRLLNIMRQLRDKNTGCQWDYEQDFESLSPYTIEEAYEVVDAIESGKMELLPAELGDLLLQIVFHSQIADEQGLFTFGDVVTSICDKMIARHPHIFLGDGPLLMDSPPDWEEMKAKERERDGAKSALDGIASALPALVRAQKIQARASKVGFDWPDIHGASAKILEELEEFHAAQSEDEAVEEMGDLLFAVVNVARHGQIDAEKALRRAIKKFETRFQYVENMWKSQYPGQDMRHADTNILDGLWEKAKKHLKA